VRARCGARLVPPASDDGNPAETGSFLRSSGPHLHWMQVGPLHPVQAGSDGDGIAAGRNRACNPLMWSPHGRFAACKTAVWLPHAHSVSITPPCCNHMDVLHTSKSPCGRNMPCSCARPRQVATTRRILTVRDAAAAADVAMESPLRRPLVSFALDSGTESYRAHRHGEKTARRPGAVGRAVPAGGSWTS
jgi:hypothetical protein